MVFKTVIATVVNQVLGEYVSNLQTDQLELGMWDGQVKLQHLKLRKDIFQRMGLPIEVVDGIIGEITLSIPWSDLAKQPLKIDLKDVFILAAATKNEWDPEGEQAKEQHQKMEKLYLYLIMQSNK